MYGSAIVILVALTVINVAVIFSMVSIVIHLIADKKELYEIIKTIHHVNEIIRTKMENIDE